MKLEISRSIDQATDNENLKSVLKQITSAINTIDKYRQQDLIFTKGSVVVLNGDDGHYYSITVSGTTPAVTLTDLGRKIP